MKKEKTEVYIRKDGWVFSKEGMKRLVDGGHKGHAIYEQHLTEQIGTRHRVLRPLDREAADILKSIKGIAARAVFLSTAIMQEHERRASRNKEEKK